MSERRGGGIFHENVLFDAPIGHMAYFCVMRLAIIRRKISFLWVGGV